MNMTDPSDGLRSFQKAFRDGELRVQRGELDRDLFVHLNHPNGELRLTYVRVKGKKVTAFVTFVRVEPIENLPCFQIGYAVPEAERGKGSAKGLINSSIEELKAGLAKNGVRAFYVEAVVGAENEASKRVAAATISAIPVPGTGHASGESALQYVKKIEL